MRKSNFGALKTYGRLFVIARPFWRSGLAFLLISLLATPLALLVPLPLKLAVDCVIGDQPLPSWLAKVLPDGWVASSSSAAMVVVVMIVLLSLLTSIQQMGVSLIRTYFGERLVMNFRAMLFRHGQRLSLSYHDTKGSVDSIYRIHNDATSIQSLVIDSFIPVFTALLTLCGMLYVTARLNLQLALVGIAVAPILVVLRILSSRQLRSGWREVAQLESSALSVVQESFSAARVVKAFGREEHENARYLGHSASGFRARLRITSLEGGIGLLTGLTMAVGTSAVLWIGMGDVRSGTMTVGSLLLVMSYLGQIYGPLKTLSKQVVGKQKALASAERALELLDELPEVPERADALPLGRALGNIAFRKVAFSYPSSAPVLKDVSFEVPAGTLVGVMGRTGAGKTTLVNLLTRFYDPVAGQILLDGVDLRDYRLVDLRKQFSLVLQDPVLFSTTIYENIAYGRLGATETEVREAAKAANAHEFIMALPDGYDTEVGDRGTKLSGGERQRISLARAFLKNAPLLILDEPTSSIDTSTEQVIMQAMERLVHGRTTFMIAHRLSTLEGCDMLLNVEHGMVRVVASEDVRELPEPAEDLRDEVPVSA